MLRIAIDSEAETRVLDHQEGQLVFGSAPVEGQQTIVLHDAEAPGVCVRVRECQLEQLHVENLSEGLEVKLDPDRVLGPGRQCVVKLPILLSFGATELRLSSSIDEETERFEGIPMSVWRGSSAPHVARDLGIAENADLLAHCFDTLIQVEQAAATSGDFRRTAAQAVVELLGLDRSQVLEREPDGWRVTACYPDDSSDELSRPSDADLSLFEEVTRQRRTLLRVAWPDADSDSPVTVVASPVLDAQLRVAAVLCGAVRDGGDEPIRVNGVEAQVVQLLGNTVGAGIARQVEHERAQESLSHFRRYFSPGLARTLMHEPELLEGREVHVTVLFTDVRHFSTISERIGARDTFALMQDIMELQSEHVKAFDGVVVDFVGDGMLAMWNAPAAQADHAERACCAALSIQQELPKLSETWAEKIGSPIELGYGVNSGKALVGNTGSRLKFKYGPMGSTVNLASRVEDATKALGVPALITEATADDLPEAVALRRLGGVLLPGFDKPTQVYELHGIASSPEWKERRATFENALDLYESGDWAQAAQRIFPVLTEAEGVYDVPSLQLLGRAVECLRSAPEPFDPTIDLTRN